MAKVYKDPPYCWWREFIMWHGVGVMVLCGWLVGKRYFNKVLTQICEGPCDFITPDTPGFEKGWEEDA